MVCVVDFYCLSLFMRGEGCMKGENEVKTRRRASHERLKRGAW